MKRRLIVLGLAAAALLGLFVLGVSDEPSLAPASSEASGGELDQAMAKEEAADRRRDAPMGKKFAATAPAEPSPKLLAEGATANAVGGALPPAPPPEGSASSAGPATRAWFPQTFLFEPLVVTDAQGHADVPVRVPDRLTSWRVLALAHSRQGSQAGAVASFLGTLPTYVDAITPPFLLAGDQVRLPIQVVNTTGRELSAPLTLSVTGATLASAGGPVRVPAAGEVVRYVTLTTTRPGQASLRAALGSSDAVQKDIVVRPTGQRAVQTRGGTLATERTFELTGPLDALAGTESVRVRVFPGALGLVRAELSAAPGRGGVAEDAYLLQLLGQAPALLRSLGATPDEALIRELTLLATQRALRHARAPSPDAAALLAEAAAAHPDSPVLARMAERLASQVARSQRADGTCQGETGWTVQRLLVSTADCVRAVRSAATTPAGRQRATAVAVKAAGAFERSASRIADGYTAAAVLAAGTASPASAVALRKLVLDHLITAPDGARYLEVAPGVVRADGQAPSTYEATALAVLGLGEAPVVADLGTWLMSGYSASWGWGDGRANLVALRAAVQLFRAPVPAGVTVTVSRDGVVLARGTLDAAALTDVLTLDADARGSAGAHTWRLEAEPAVPGLGYSLQLVAFTPWKAVPGGGLSLTASLPALLQVGHGAEVTLTAGLPGNTLMLLALPLPAGVQPDTASLLALVRAGKVIRYESEEGLVRLHLPPQRPGAVYTAALTVVPTLAGRLQAGSPSLAPEGNPGQEQRFAPSTWSVRE